jgi:hypothetical protein
MNARLTTTAALAGLFAATLPARAADQQLLNLVMPDAAVLAGVNVEQAKTSSFGQFVLNQVQNSDIQKLAALTGFDPTRDVHEVLAAVGPAGSKTALALARGSFHPDQIAAAAAAKGGTTTESYGGVTIIEDLKQTHGVAFLTSPACPAPACIAVAGDLASVKAALDRQNSTTSSLPATVLVQVNNWSTSEDAWVISTVPPGTLHPSASTPSIPGVGPGAAANTALQAIQAAAGGVKFGDNIVVTAQATSDTAQNAENLANTLKLLAAVAQLQAQNNAGLQTLAQSLKVTTATNQVNITFSMPQTQLQGILTQPHTEHHPARVQRKM